MTFSQILISFVVVYLCVYALIRRICRCIEHCATAKSYLSIVKDIEKALKQEEERDETKNPHQE